MKNLSKALILGVFYSAVAGFAVPALAYNPGLSVYDIGGGNSAVSITNAQPNASVVVTYTPVGSFLQTQITGNTDYSGSFSTTINSASGSQVTATVAGQFLNSNNNGGCVYYGCGGCAYNCGSGTLSLSQTSLSLNSGQSQTITVYSNGYGGTPYISSNSNSGVATASVSGNSVYVYGQSSGSTNISICQSSSNQCATLYVTVNGNGSCGYYGCGVCTYNCGSGTLSLSQTSLSLNSGQSSTVTVYSSTYSSTPYISSNSNSGVATASVSGNSIYVYGQSAGSTTISVCQNSSSQCASLYVTVGGGYNGGVGSLTLSPNSLSLNVGQTSYVTASMAIYNPSFYISSNSNSAVVTASVFGNQISLYGLTSGSSTISVCASGGNACASIYVTVNGNGYNGNGNVWFNPTSASLYSGQSLVVSLNSASGNGYSATAGNPYYVSNNSNPSAVSASVSGTVLNLYANQSGTSIITVCLNSLSFCGTLPVTVNGGGYNGGSLSLSQTNVNLSVGQNANVIANNYNGGSLYIASNSNSTVAYAVVNGNSITIYGQNNGTSNFSICANNGQCVNLYVTVGGGVLGASTANVVISDNYFNPRTIIMPIGSTIVWTNSGSMTHTVTADDNSFSGGSMGPGATFSHTFSYAGTFPYHCIFHGGVNGVGMSGVIVISGNGGGYGGGSSVWFSPSSVNLNYGQSQSVTVYSDNGNNYNNNYYVSTNSNARVASASISGNILNLYGQQSGSATINVCQSSYGNCGTLYVTVGGGYNGSGCTYNCGGGLSYPGGSVMGASNYPSGELISEGPTIYMVYKNLKTPFANASAFLGLGFKFYNVTPVGDSGLANSGYTVSSSHVQHPWGTWVKSGSTVYFVHESGLIPVPDWNTFLNNGGQSNFIVTANYYDLRLPRLSPMVSGDSRTQ